MKLLAIVSSITVDAQLAKKLPLPISIINEN